MNKQLIKQLIQWYKKSPHDIKAIRKYVSDYVINRGLTEKDNARIYEYIMGDKVYKGS
jgi:hypothetical protein